MKRLEIKTFGELAGTMSSTRGKYDRERIRISAYGPNEEGETVPYIGSAIVVSFHQLIGVPNLAILFVALLKMEAFKATESKDRLKLDRIIKLIRLKYLKHSCRKTNAK